MKLLYTNENRFLVSNAKNIVENAGVAVILRNEYAGGAVGEIPPFDAWMELWVVNDADYERAMQVIGSSLSPDYAMDWVCNSCGERNAAAFEWCWNCRNENR